MLFSLSWKSRRCYPFFLEETTPSLGEYVLPFEKLRMRREVLVTGKPGGRRHGKETSSALTS
jgi:hypothetical protein